MPNHAYELAKDAVFYRWVNIFRAIGMMRSGDMNSRNDGFCLNETDKINVDWLVVSTPLKNMKVTG